MAEFHYIAYDGAGKRVRGQLQADDAAEAGRRLRADHLTPVKLEERLEAAAGLFGGSRLRLTDLEFLTAELSLLVANGVRIDRAMEVIARGATRPALRQLCQDLVAGLRRGEPLADNLRRHAQHFDSLYISLVEVGEASGKLDTVLASLAENLRFRRELRSKILLAMSYPLVVLGVCVLALLLVFNFVVPQLAGLFASAPELPLYTQLLLGTSEWMQANQLWLGLGLVAFVLMVRFGLRTAEFRAFADEAALRLPVTRSMVTQVERIRYCSALALTLEAGLVVDRAMQLSAATVGNGPLRGALEAASEQVKRGESVTTVLGRTPLLDGSMLSLVEVGEEAGALGPIFTDVAGHAREGFENWVLRFTKVLEPLMILFMSVIVGGIVMVMLLSVIAVQDVQL